MKIVGGEGKLLNENLLWYKKDNINIKDELY